METISFLLFFLSSIILSYLTLFKEKRKRNYPPGPTRFPIIGNVLNSGIPLLKLADLHNSDITEALTRNAEKYGEIFTLKIGPYNAVFLNEPSIIREAFSNPVFSGRISNNIVFEAFSKGNYGIALGHGPNYIQQKSFTVKHFKNFGFGKSTMELLVQEEGAQLVKHFREFSIKGLPFDPSDEFSLASINATWVIMTSKRFELNDQKAKSTIRNFFRKLDEAFFRSNLGAFPILAKIAPELSGFNELVSVMDATHEFFDSQIEEHAKCRTSVEPKDFIDAYLDEIEKNKDDPTSNFHGENGRKNLIAIMADILTGGGETTAITMSWTILFLFLNPQVKKKFVEEIDEVIGHSRQPYVADKKRMPYTEALILESLRKSSIANIGVPHTSVDDAKLRGYDIPKNSIVVPFFNRVHHNPRDWDEPQKFKPERFLRRDSNDNGELKFVNNENVMPFSVGKRACIGEHAAKDMLFILLTSLYQKYDISLDPSSGPIDLNPRLGFIDRPMPYKIVVEERGRGLGNLA